MSAVPLYFFFFGPFFLIRAHLASEYEYACPTTSRGVLEALLGYRAWRTKLSKIH